MPGYAVLGKGTQPLTADVVKSMPDQVQQFKTQVEKMGVRIVGIWTLMGQYDVLVVLDAPDDQTAVMCAMALGRSGLKTETVRAFGEDEFGQMLSRMS